MRKIKYLFLISIAFVCILVLCSCSCYPAEFSWGIRGIHCDVTYVNGQTVRTYITSNVYERQPIGISSDDTYINFYEDGRVEFKPVDSDVLWGTYSLKHNGLSDTNFTVAFENGEKIENGYAVAYIYGRDLNFDFRGVTYEFNDGYDTNSKEELDNRTEWLIKDVRAVGNYLYRGEVTLEDGGGKLSSEDLEENVDLFAEGRRVTAIHISVDNELTILDDLRDGECVFAYSGVTMVDGVKVTGVVIYYVDPLPEELPPEGPIEYGVLDIIPELEYYMEHPENTLLKLTREHKPALVGEFNEHLYKTEREDVEFWLNHLAEITLIELEDPRYDIEEQHIRYVMRFEDKTEEHNLVIINFECGMICRGDKWYSCITFPTWEGGRRVYSFSCRNYSMKALNGAVEYYSINGIEFQLDTKQDYEYPEEHYVRVFEGEVGEIAVYDATHFYYNGYYYIVTSEKDFALAYC